MTTGLFGMGGHQAATGGNDEWLTPPHILKAIGEFDLDPCAPRIRPWEIAKQHYTVMENGLALPWAGRVWLNPPYGKETWRWMKRLASHGNGIALVFARTETEHFFECVWELADAVFFLRGRLNFYHQTGRMSEYNSGAPSCLVAYGQNNVDALRRSGLSGKLIILK